VKKPKEKKDGNFGVEEEKNNNNRLNINAMTALAPHNSLLLFVQINITLSLKSLLPEIKFTTKGLK